MLQVNPGNYQRLNQFQQLREKLDQGMKAMREEMREEMKRQIAQVIIKLKPEIIRAGLT